MDIKKYLSEKRAEIELRLADFIKNPQAELSQHFETLQYSLLAGGKRVRPILCIAAAESLGCQMDSLISIACSLEYIHTYSLVHDDLPAMDDDDLRRGKPTNHKVYGEAAAILAGDGLLTFAFEILSSPDYFDNISQVDQLRIIQLISRAAGSHGMVGGQALDIKSEQKQIPFERLKLIHRCKTGALISAAVKTGAIIGKATKEQYMALTIFGDHIGLAFQIVDDLLNVEGTTEQLGKAAGSDAERQKATYPAFFGVEETRKKAKETIDTAVDALHAFDKKADPLRELAKYVYTRTN